MAEADLPSEDEIREALGRVAVADVLLNALTATASLGFHRLTAEARDLEQARLAIEALRALEPVLREGGVDEAVLRDLEQARANLQLAYAKAVGEAASGPAGEGRPPPGAEATPATEETAPDVPADGTPASGEEPAL